MPKLRRYCWRVGVAVELDDSETCVECGLTGTMHRALPDQTKCGFYAAITDSSGAPCFLEIGHAGPHAPDPEGVQYYADQGKKIMIGDEMLASVLGIGDDDD